MMTLLIIMLAGLALGSISLQKTYSHVPLKELKRRARAGDITAVALHRAVAYGASLRLLLWLLVGASSGLFFVMIARAVDSAWLAFLGCALLIWIGFGWTATGRVSLVGSRLAFWLTPPIAWLLRHIHPLLDQADRLLRRLRTVQVHTGTYEKEDLIELIKRQQHQADNRLTLAEFQLAINSLTFGDKLVRDHLTPRRVVKAVAFTDSIGPVLMDELHDSGHSRFPVYQDAPDNVVGTLYLRDLVEVHASGRVRDVMKKAVFFIHEEQSLHEALTAMLKTNHHLFVVVNSFEELVGIITIEDVLEQILGRPIIDEFDRYEDLRAVAKQAARREHQAHQETFL